MMFLSGVCLFVIPSPPNQLDSPCAIFQASAVFYLMSSLFRDFVPPRLVLSFRRNESTYGPIFKVQAVDLIGLLEDGVDILSRNVGNSLPTCAAQHPRKAKTFSRPVGGTTLQGWQLATPNTFFTVALLSLQRIIEINSAILLKAESK
jgi:hypothetical protein